MRGLKVLTVCLLRSWPTWTVSLRTGVPRYPVLATQFIQLDLGRKLAALHSRTTARRTTLTEFRIKVVLHHPSLLSPGARLVKV